MSAPDWLHDAIFYQIFPERFANGDTSLDPPDVVPWDSEPTRDNFFGGDLRGIIDHLDHLVELGVNALYLTPIFEAETNHRYDAVDYFTIDHRLGSLEDFREFLAACHAHGIRVVLDAVLNHCGYQHGAFQDVISNEAASAYVNWYSVEGFPVTAQPEPNYRTCSGCWYLPKWNAYNPEVREHHHQVARRWIEEGIDGWRLDVPYFINHTFWRGFRDVVKGVDDDLYIVAEEWRDPVEWLQGDIADGTMNYTLRDLLRGFTAARSLGAFAFAPGMNDLTGRIPDGYQHGMLNLLGSHDTERVLTRHGGDRRATLLAYDLLFASAGAPMVYYGDEIGLTGDNDPGCRGAFPWDPDRWDAGLLDHLRQLARTRTGSAALRRGSQIAIALSPDAIIVGRCHEGEAAVLVANRGDAAVTVTSDTLDKLSPGCRWAGATDGSEVVSATIVPAHEAVWFTTTR